MGRLSTTQRKTLVDIMEAFINHEPIPETLITDPMVVGQFIELAQKDNVYAYHFIKKIEPSIVSTFTVSDAFTEEHMMALHSEHGFSMPTIIQWLRGLDFGGYTFFTTLAESKGMLNLKHIKRQARNQISVVNGVIIDSVTVHFNDIDKMMEYALLKRINIRQMQDMLVSLNPEQHHITECMDQFVASHNVFQKITSSKQIYPFRVFCACFDFLDDKNKYIEGVAQVFDHLFQSASIPKAMGLLNTMPYSIIEFMLHRIIEQERTPFLDYLSKVLPQYTHGAIRKIVRRQQLGVNYKYD
jgi:hypothetical protein